MGQLAESPVSEPGTRFTRTLRRLSLACAGIATAIVILAMSESSFLESIRPEWGEMRSVGAACIILAACGLTALNVREARAWLTTVTRAISAIVAAIGLLTICAVWVSFSKGSEPSFVHWPFLLSLFEEPARMSLTAALAFVMLGSSLLLLTWPRRLFADVAHGVILAMTLFSYLVILGYLYGVKSFYSLYGIPLSITTSLALLAMGMGVLCSRGDTWLMRVIVSDYAGGHMALRLLPAAVLIPLVVGYLRVQGERLGLFESAAGAGVVAIANTVLLLAVAWLTARVVNRVDQDRRIAEQSRIRLEVQAKQEWERTFDSVPDLIAIMDRDHHIVRANQAMAQRLGRKPEECAGLLCYQVLHGTQAPPAICPHELTLRDEKQHTAQIHEDRLGGDFLVTTTPLRDAGGLMIGSVHIARDITDLRRAEEAMRESEQRYRGLFENMLDGYAYCRILYENGAPRDFIYLGVNSAFDRLTGLKDVVGKKASQVIPGLAQSDPELLQTYGRVATTGQAERFETYLNSLKTWFSISVYSPEKDYFVAVFDNITGRKRSEEALRQATSDLVRSNQDLAQFANVASHDLQEPLRMVENFLKLLDEQYGPQLDDKAREYVGFAVDGAERMSRLISDLLAYSRVGPGGAGFVQTDMEAVLTSALGNLRTSVEEAQADITHDPLPTLKADTSLIVQLFQNLISNAIKYRSKDTKPQIHVGARRENRGWLFWVRDNGIGINAEDRDRIFMIFLRLHTRERYPGTGIGLAICKRIAEYHCGRIWVESEVGKGSTFYFTIPDRDGYSLDRGHQAG